MTLNLKSLHLNDDSIRKTDGYILLLLNMVMINFVKFRNGIFMYEVRSLGKVTLFAVIVAIYEKKLFITIKCHMHSLVLVAYKMSLEYSFSTFYLNFINSQIVKPSRQ